MVPGERETSNTETAIESDLFETLEEWNDLLTAEGIELAELPTSPAKPRAPARGPRP